MAVHVIKRGLDLPITGAPAQTIADGRAPTRVAVMAEDYPGMRPQMRVAVDDAVKRGQPLFEDKKTPGVLYTAPAAGRVIAINRGARRALVSVVIELSEAEKAGKLGGDDEQRFESYAGKDPGALSRDELVALLVESGLWTAFRTRPFSRVPNPQSTPHSIFVTAIDSSPLAADPAVVLKGAEADFQRGLSALTKLTDNRVFVCKRAGAAIPVPKEDKLAVEEFSGPHPSGLPGTHIHLLDPVSRDKVVWHLNYQDVTAIGRLLTTGRLDVARVVALGGPVVKQPRLIRTRLGAWLDETVQGELADGPNRVVSGSVLCGRAAAGDVHGYLGRYHLQVSALRDHVEREFLGWMMPGFTKYSVVNVFASRLTPKKQFAFTTALNGSHRAMVPIGTYEKVMPMDILPTFLLRSLVVGDLEASEQLGCLELDEEDLGLCTFVCPGKINYAPALRAVLTQIEKEG